MQSVHVRWSVILSVCGVGIAIGFVYCAYRLYLRVGRRCGKCGNIFTRRESEIYLPPDELLTSPWQSLHKPSAAGVSLNVNVKWWRRYRWWVRRVITVTYSYCPSCRRRIVEKVGRGPISIWHLWWVKWFHREQYLGVHKHLVDAYARALRANNSLERGGPSDFGDDPPVNLGLADWWQERIADESFGSGTPPTRNPPNKSRTELSGKE